MKRIENFIYQTLILFSFLGIVFIPFSFQYFSIQSVTTKLLFQNLIANTVTKIGNITISNPEITSDSTTLYGLFFVLLFLSSIFTIVFSLFNFWKIYKNQINKVFQIVLVYYLACVMLKYGFDKIFKVQFYLPEPNTLYTPLGMLDKDILFWSTMGTSFFYNVFMGLIEIIPALMLFYNKTRTLGLCILFGVLINVVFVNFGFDISVKLYSLFLILICFLLLVPNLKKIIQFFISNKPTALSKLKGSDLITSKPIRITIKTFIIFFIFMESLFPYIRNQNFNNDNSIQNPLRGAYEVVKVEKNDTTKNSVNLKIKRIFIHRDNYFIFQYADDTMEDYYLEINETRNQFTLINYNGEKIILNYKFAKNSKTLTIYSPELGINIYSKLLPWKKLPLLQPLFHWTVDEIH
ncbi:hypothetical protein [Flavobacterium hercynium]|uniref:DoxX family protein n=1 Tax=Flavobacterium hercynium TaxID=387094 RepID=A0A226GUJ1_9FLAO|nr:hypothetical protein [Flavobacterium hercynium]OXA85702.1 hypothetical protein B0A66_19055 [Flavobacterium hercynium]SMP30250.1 hypothetical protein SAMN06265346_1135 [Flavobacterium hercynium]